MRQKIHKTDAQWRTLLSEEQYLVTRQHGTEPAFTGAYYDHHDDGRYCCVCCGLELFDSRHKFDSGSGWPSFWQATDDHVDTFDDSSHGMRRTEIRCTRCDAHLGHVFTDGPQPSGLRYCVNSASLIFKE